MTVHLHPDQMVIIQDDNGNDLYLDTVINFEADWGQQLEDIPEPWTGLHYVQGQWKRYYNQFTNETTVEAWAQGDQIASDIDAIVAAKVARESA